MPSIRRQPSTKTTRATVQQGGRFASASDNIKNKGNTARLQGESTFEVIDAQGNTVQYNTAQYQQYQKAQQEKARQQAQQQRQRNIIQSKQDQRKIIKTNQERRSNEVTLSETLSASERRYLDKRKQNVVTLNENLSASSQAPSITTLGESTGFRSAEKPTKTSARQSDISIIPLAYADTQESFKPTTRSSSYTPPPVLKKPQTRGQARYKGVSKSSDSDILLQGIGKVNPMSDLFREDQSIRQTPSGIKSVDTKPTLEKPLQIPKGKSSNVAAFIQGSEALAQNPTFQSIVKSSQSEINKATEFFAPKEKPTKTSRRTKSGFKPSPKQTFGETNFIQENRQRLEGAYEEAKNMVLDIAQGELKYGAGFARTTGGKIIPATKEAKELSETLESNYSKNTFSQKLFEGRFGEIDFTDPKTQGQGLMFGTSIIAPTAGPAAKVKIGQILEKQAESFAVRRTENFLKEIGDFLGLEKLQATKTITTEKIIVPKNKSVPQDRDVWFKSSKEVPVKGSQSVYISSGGTAEKPTPFYVLRRSMEKGWKDPILEEITPAQADELQTLLPKNINIRGSLSAFEQQQMGLEPVKKTPGRERFVFTSKDTPTIEQQRFYKEGVLNKAITETGKGKEAPLEGIINRDLAKYTKRGIQYKSSVYSETKAEQPVEKFIEQLGKETTPKGKRPSTPFGFSEKGSVGAGSPGKGQSMEKTFTKSEQDFIKRSVTPKTPKAQTSQSDLKYFAGTILSQPEFDYPISKPQQQSQKMFDPFSKGTDTKSGSSGMVGISDFIKTSVIPKRQQKGFLGISDKLSVSFTPALQPKITPRQTPRQQPSQGVGLNDKLTIELKQSFITPPTTQQSFIFAPPPERIPPVTPAKLLPFVPYFPRTYLGSFGYENPASLKTAYAAYGISSDINIKTLPTYSRYSPGKDVFKAQAKEDEMIQNLFYGKPKTKKSKSKKSGKSKSKKKTKKTKKK